MPWRRPCGVRREGSTSRERELTYKKVNAHPHGRRARSCAGSVSLPGTVVVVFFFFFLFFSPLSVQHLILCQFISLGTPSQIQMNRALLLIRVDQVSSSPDITEWGFCIANRVLSYFKWHIATDEQSLAILFISRYSTLRYLMIRTVRGIAHLDRVCLDPRCTIRRKYQTSVEDVFWARMVVLRE